MRARIVVLALVLTPFLAGHSQSRAHHKESAHKESSVRKQALGEVEQQGKMSNDSSCPTKASNHQNQEGQHEDGKCETAPPTTPPVVKPPVVKPPVAIADAQIHGTVYNDLNGNGKLDYLEPGLAGWTVTLSGPVIATAVTIWDGSYEFIALPVGSYAVCAVPQAGYVATAPTTGPCAGGFGWRVDVPPTAGMWFGAIDFGVK